MSEKLWVSSVVKSEEEQTTHVYKDIVASLYKFHKNALINQPGFHASCRKQHNFPSSLATKVQSLAARTERFIVVEFF